ncbi:helix-turn-helix domain-containing protein [Microbacterium sp. bgisy203]|uniref:helix-turn-helix domain-containing protein n=1 Tax=Microbacterium sp. bgisy203 TaxID=3413799 RepID=UPI003D7625E0
MPVPASQTTPEQRSAWKEARTLVGHAVRTARLSAGLTQEALALESGVTRNMLIHLEHGDRGISFERLYDLANALGIEPAHLMPAPERNPDQ